ncbi:MAG: ATP-dependent sacrificial sulfur transferase LarE, partial [Candidatus Aminicenantes bacterium]|nr:ATP-dependent sacrificial sulfur transferase LarE [Candidatus Aminicenantes bacterium]
HRVFPASELADPAFRSNPPLRCYHCKRALFAALRRIAGAEGLRHVLDGSNADDASDYRPGARACRELKVRSPLRDAGLSKAEVRLLSRALRLPTWDKPARACLASRFPYGRPIDAKSLMRVERAEDALIRLGFGQVRVRHHGPVARVETAAADFGRMLDAATRAKISRRLKRLGYAYVALDLDGYRTGSLNEPLNRKRRRGAGARR